MTYECGFARINNGNHCWINNHCAVCGEIQNLRDTTNLTEEELISLADLRESEAIDDYIQSN